MAQKSCPNGAPMRAAAASIAVMPGSTRTSIPCADAGLLSTASNTAAAIAKTPGSPPETTATRWPSAASARARSARANSSRLSDASKICPARGVKPVHVLRIAEHDICVRDGFARRRSDPAFGAWPKTDDGQLPAHVIRRPRPPGSRMIEKYGTAPSFNSASGTTLSPCIVPRST